MNAVFLRQLRQRHFLADRLKRDLGFEIPLSSKLRFDCRAVGRMVLSFLHFGSSLSSRDPP